jgi:hypothetical protein
LNSAFPPEQINSSPVEGQPRPSFLTFAGNGVDTVTWVGSGGASYGTVLYQGVLCGIAPDPAGSTAKYVYFDPGAENPTILYGTNDRSDLEGHERFVVCVNQSGVAYPQPCVRLGQNATLIGVEEGATVGATWNENITNQPAGYLIQWQGTHAAAPAGAVDGWAYYNSTLNQSYLYHDGDWHVLTVDGLAGADGANGINGADGVSILWQGNLAGPPVGPPNGWAYYNSTDHKSYVYQDGQWYQMTVDGVTGPQGPAGSNGLAIVWKGESATPPADPQENWVYRDTDNGYPPLPYRVQGPKSFYNHTGRNACACPRPESSSELLVGASKRGKMPTFL